MKPLYALLPLAALLTFSACREDDEEPCDPVQEQALAEREAELDRREAALIARERALGMGPGGSGSAAYGGRNGAQGADASYVDARGRGGRRATDRSRAPRMSEEGSVAYRKPVYFPGQYPEASERTLTSADLEYKSDWGKKVMMNEIYARHGLIFTEPELRKHFNGESWYRGTKNNVDSKLTPVEQQNIALIRASI